MVLIFDGTNLMVASFLAYCVNGYDIANLVFLAADCNCAFLLQQLQFIVS